MATLFFLTNLSTVFTSLSNYTRHHKSEHHIVIYETMEKQKILHDELVGFPFL